MERGARSCGVPRDGWRVRQDSPAGRGRLAPGLVAIRGRRRRPRQPGCATALQPRRRSLRADHSGSPVLSRRNIEANHDSVQIGPGCRIASHDERVMAGDDVVPARCERPPAHGCAVLIGLNAAALPPLGATRRHSSAREGLWNLAMFGADHDWPAAPGLPVVGSSGPDLASPHRRRRWQHQ